MKIQSNHFFLEKVFSKLPPELQDFFCPFLEYFFLSSIQRIVFFSVGAIVCIILLYFLLRKKKKFTPPNEKSLLNLVSQYHLNYSYGELVRKILHPQKNYKKFLENSDFFEKQLEKYQAQHLFNEEQEEKINQMRKKLQFNTSNTNNRFYKTQQLHSGVILKISINTEEGTVSFDSKVLENYESYFLVSYPQIQKEEHTLTTNQELLINIVIGQANYHFHTKLALDNLKKHLGLHLMHTSEIKQSSIF